MIILPLTMIVMIYGTIVTLLYSILKLGVLFCVPVLYRLNEVLEEHEHRFIHRYIICICIFTFFTWLGYGFDDRVIVSLAIISTMISTLFIVCMYGVIGIGKVWNKLYYKIQMKRHDLKRANNLD